MSFPLAFVATAFVIELTPGPNMGCLAIVLLAGTLQPWLEDEARSRIARRVLSLLRAAIAVWLLIVTKHPGG